MASQPTPNTELPHAPTAHPEDLYQDPGQIKDLTHEEINMWIKATQDRILRVEVTTISPVTETGEDAEQKRKPVSTPQPANAKRRIPTSNILLF